MSGERIPRMGNLLLPYALKATNSPNNVDRGTYIQKDFLEKCHKVYTWS
jgi:hypothetical protein